mmetsp:Transcript_21582/g.40607  ORF Transcript_21582/g.40607 Transcript_21582/m.40607 type:complete len:215 (+) Transcript_21582:204-848(+)
MSTFVDSHLALATNASSDFLQTNDFRRYFIQFAPPSSLLSLRQLSKEWSEIVTKKLDAEVSTGKILVHGGDNVPYPPCNSKLERVREPLAPMASATHVIFLLNITQIGIRACFRAIRLLEADIPEGVECINTNAFKGCSNLKTVSFPTTLSTIGVQAFSDCSRLEAVDLLHTNIQDIRYGAFQRCTALRVFKVPPSLLSDDSVSRIVCRVALLN